jgi:hypothetical protein
MYGIPRSRIARSKGLSEFGGAMTGIKDLNIWTEASAYKLAGANA